MVAAGKRLRVRIGPHREALEVAWVNGRPTEIDTEWFVGRVLVRVKDFRGVTPDGSEPLQDVPYFAGRSRKFAIHIEGRFRTRAGQEPFNGDEVEFGTDFDRLIEFPRSLFNAGMRVAKMVDSSVHYDVNASKPFIMSPYAACMNLIAAWPAPEAVNDAVVCLRHTETEAPDAEHSAGSSNEADDFVPEDVLDQLAAGKSEQHASRHLRRYWRFIGFRDDPAVERFLSDIAPDLFEQHFYTPFIDSRHADYLAVGGRDGADHGRVSPPATLSASPHSTAPLSSSPPSSMSPSGTLAPPPAAGGRFGFSALKKALKQADAQPAAASRADYKLANEVTSRRSSLDSRSEVERELGPWRFGAPGVDLIEDNTALNGSFKPITTAKRRSHFSSLARRQQFTYDPDVVYATSFFTPFADLNTFSLKMGSMMPQIDLLPRLGGMPIRYTLRSTRLNGPKLASSDGPEPIPFATVEFQLVDA